MNITLDGLSKFFGGKVVFSSLHYTFPDGKITCITGPSGCGKTTLLCLMLGLISSDAGSIRGLPKGPIPTVFQEDRLIESLSATANIQLVLPGNFPKERIHAALASIGLDGQQKVHAMSGGMRRRVALVRALLADGPVVLMDEPFKGLDADTRQTAIEFALPLLKGRTTLIVTHDPDEIVLLNANVFQLQKNG